MVVVVVREAVFTEVQTLFNIVVKIYFVINFIFKIGNTFLAFKILRAQKKI